MKRLIFINRKGGAGKTTSAVNVSAALVKMGKRVLLVDTDTQAHATLSLGVKEAETTILDVLRGREFRPLQVREGLFLVPASPELSSFEVEAVKEPRRLLTLKSFLDGQVLNFDFAVIDAPPTLGPITLCGLLASEEVVVPLPPHFLALKGLAETKALVDKVRRRNPILKLAWVLPTFFNPRLRHARAVLEEVKRVFGEKILLPPVGNSVRLAEAPSFGQTIFEYAPESPGAKSYLKVAQIILAGGVDEPGNVS